MVTVKFQVTSVASSIGFEGVKVQLSPISTMLAGENLSLFKGSPVGSIELFVTTSEGVGFFEIGKNYLITFSPEQ